MLPKTLVRVLLLISLLVLNFSATAAPAVQSDGKIGVLAPLSGDFARYGARVRNGILAASVSEERFRFEDEGCSPKQALTAYRALTAAAGIRIFLGPMCGSPQVVIAPLLARDGGIAMLGNSAPKRVYRESQGRMLSSQSSIEQESTFNAQQIARFGVQKVVTILYDSDFSRTHDTAFKQAFTGKVLETLVHSAADQTEIRSFALRVKQLHPDAIYVPDAYPLILGLLKELRRLDLAQLPVFSVYAAQSSDVLEASGGSADQLIYSYPDIGEEDALEYFPKLATTMLVKAMSGCGADQRCVLARLKADNEFDQDGALKGTLVLKTVRDGKFVKFDGQTEQGWKEERGRSTR